MIIDFHCHIFREEWLPERFWIEFTQFLVASSKQPGGQLSPELVEKEILPSLWDPKGEKQIQAMDEAGIDMAGVVLLDYGLLMGEPLISIEDQNKSLAELAKRHRGRFIPFVGIDPRRENAVNLLEKGVREWGMKGLKLHPCSGFYPNDESIYPIFAKAQELGIPVSIHTGFILGSLKSKYAYPLYLDDVLADFPQLKIVAVHLGDSRGAWWQEAASLAYMRPNFYMDLCGWQSMAKDYFADFCSILRTVLDRAGADRVLLGTDGPVNRGVLSDKEWVELLRSLPKNAPKGIKFREDEIEAILGKNAENVLGL